MFNRPAFTSHFLHLFVLLVAGLISKTAFAQVDDLPKVTYPHLPRQAPSAEGFVPSGWKLELMKVGDLNGDGIADLLMVLHQNDPANLVPNKYGLGVDTLDTNPRILAVAFGSKSGYTLAAENHTLIPRRDSPTLDDPLEEGGVNIGRGTLRVSLHLWASAGSWSTSNTTYTFRYQENCFKLIGYDRNELRRNSGETTDLSINYLSRKAKVVHGSIEDSKQDVKWKPVPNHPLLCMDEVGDGFEFNPEP
ncbi:MAG: hypothetical protein HGB11_06700 [Chlorobiales bacterium]|nr:hypothetical protein [Chlorobiales bacterium]